MTTTSIREAIHERLNPIIEEIVSRELSQREPQAGQPQQQQAGQQQRQQPAQQQQQQPFEALTPILLSVLARQQWQPLQQPVQPQQNPLAVSSQLAPVTRRWSSFCPRYRCCP